MLFRIIILLIILFLNNSIYAKRDNLSNIIINSDDLVVDKNTSSSVFSGNVILWFDNGLIIKTDKVIIKIKEENNHKSIDSILLPNKLTAIKSSNNFLQKQLSEITIIASEAEYTDSKSELRLKGDVYMQESDDFVRCNELLYYTNIDKLSTSGK